jgi:hypothetical protein
MYTLHNFAHTSLDASLISKVGHILACLADNDASLFRRDDGTKGQLSLRVLLVGPWRRLPVRSEAVLFSVFGAETHTVHRISQTGEIILGSCFGCHVGEKGEIVERLFSGCARVEA